MFMTGILFVLSCLILGVPAPPGHGASLLCRVCEHDYVKNADGCKNFHKCHESCGAEVHFLNNEYYFSYRCMDAHQCDEPISGILGKRQPHHGHEHGDIACRACCHTMGCEKDLCSKYSSLATTPVPVTTTVAANGCRDYESDSFSCADYDQYNFCTDTTSIAHAIAHDKCAKHCGFCSTDGAATTIEAFPTTAAVVTPAVVNVNISSGGN
ncbi:uncharacterized protein LOC123548368 [Mercenaria mercenaria]|uniref:uncharacterized protein LOC123548368 n=1 Tax=Mercenaria mercenaria TaxID=6596 RepID=UPI001E1DEA5C|nr:uncharacterized protein LOC123548368 [Mercenaria mercenaria]